MNWEDYRKVLGLSYSDNRKFTILKNKLLNFLDYSDDIENYSANSLLDFCMITGVSLEAYSHSYAYLSISSIFKNEPQSISELVFYATAYVKSCDGNSTYKHKLILKFKSILSETSINFEIINDQGDYFLLPTGVASFDKELVSEPLFWLNDYPSAKTSYAIALKQYSNNDHARDIADNFRKALEDFLHEFFRNTKNLDKNISEVSMYLKSVGGSERITSIYKNILNAYNEINNECVKHHDKIDPMFLEFLMYQTGLFIRMLIVVRKSTDK